jgi:hypothetical protein
MKVKRSLFEWRIELGRRTKMNAKEVIAARLAEWNLALSDSEIEQLVPAYERLVGWQSMLEGMLRSRQIAPGMNFPESEPITIVALDRTGGRH